MPRILPKVDFLTIKKEELDQLDVIVGSIPATYATGLVDFFRLVNHQRTLERQKEAAELLKPKDNSTGPGLVDKPN